jgi:hypothetical protein
MFDKLFGWFLERNQMGIDWSLVERLAREAREWAERYQKCNDWDFHYTMAGMCAKASARLLVLLNNNNIPAYVCGSRCHVFVKVKDMIVDVTATQFVNFTNKVLIEKAYRLRNKLVVCCNGERLQPWKSYWEAKTVLEIVNNQCVYNWKNTQRAHLAEVRDLTQGV